MKNYKIDYAYWLVYRKDYDKLIEASENYFSTETIKFFKERYKDSLYLSYDVHLDFSCGPLSDKYFYIQRKYKFMGNFSLQTERKLKLEKLYYEEFSKKSKK